jgi:hypothetical protein
MKKLTSLLAACSLAAFLAPSGAFAAKADAKAKAIAKYDTNKNGKLDPEEYEAVRKDFAATPKGVLARLDADKDGKLSDEEIAKLAGTGKKAVKSDADRAEKKAKRAEKKKV